MAVVGAVGAVGGILKGVNVDCFCLCVSCLLLSICVVLYLCLCVRRYVPYNLIDQLLCRLKDNGTLYVPLSMLSGVSISSKNSSEFFHIFNFVDEKPTLFWNMTKASQDR